MNKQMMTVEDAALALIESAQDRSPEEFVAIAEYVLEDNSPREIAAIGAHMPVVLRELLPKRTLH